MKPIYFICVVSVIFGMPYTTSKYLDSSPTANDIVQKIEPVNISIYYDTHSPDSSIFMLEQLNPVFCRVKDHVRLNFVPFGKTRSEVNHLVCRHGPEECQALVIHNCVLRNVKSSFYKMIFVQCAFYNTNEPAYLENTCIPEIGLDMKMVKRCINSRASYTLMTMAQVETKIMTYGPISVPTIVFDNKYDDRNQRLAISDFEGILCEKFEERGLYNICLNGMVLRQETC